MNRISSMNRGERQKFLKFRNQPEHKCNDVFVELLSGERQNLHWAIKFNYDKKNGFFFLFKLGLAVY